VYSGGFSNSAVFDKTSFYRMCKVQSNKMHGVWQICIYPMIFCLFYQFQKYDEHNSRDSLSLM
jgi:hypothetical protein